jgi:Glycosyltransferase family 87
MRLLDPSVALRLLLLAGFLLFAALRPRLPARTVVGLLALLSAGGLLAYGEVVTVDPATGALRLRPPPTHYHEFYHYYLGSKYFREFGHRDLYRAAVIADFEDAWDRFDPGTLVRDLETNRVDLLRGDIVRDRKRIDDSISPERWREFKSDVAFFRSRYPDPRAAAGFQLDHGYNGTPLSTFILGLLAEQPFLDLETFIGHMRWLDLYLVLFLTCLIARFEGWEIALGFLFFWSVNPLNDYGYIGGSYFRYDHFVALGLALLCFARRSLVLSGCFFALAALLRLFPALFVLSLFAHDCLTGEARKRFARNRRLYLSFGVTSLLLFGLTSTLRGPDGANAWTAFYRRIDQHESNLAANRIGLRSLINYSHEQNLEKTRINLIWEQDTARRLEARKGYYRLAAALLLGLALWPLRRAGERDAAALGIGLAFILLPLAHYYYAMLAVIPLIFRGDRSVSLLLAGSMFVFVLLESVSYLNAAADLKFACYSVAVLVLLISLGARGTLAGSERGSAA